MEYLRKYINKIFPFTPKEKELEKKMKELSKEEINFVKGIKEYW